jgi:hypothetical protein
MPPVCSNQDAVKGHMCAEIRPSLQSLSCVMCDAYLMHLRVQVQSPGVLQTDIMCRAM